MARSELLDLVQARTEGLVGERLRSVSRVIGHLAPLIAQAHAHGHSHAAIYARLLAGGLQVSWRNYRACLTRSRQRAAPQAQAGLPAIPDARAASLASAAPSLAPSPSSPTPMRAALRGAQQVAARDYTQVARALHRKNASS